MRILMLGNSLTAANGMPDLLAKRLDAEVVVHARGGARLAEHLNPKTKLGEKTQRALADERWDYVVLQEMSNGPVTSRERFLEASSSLCEMVRANGAQPVLYATWAYAPDCPKLAKLGLTHDRMHKQMHAAFAEAALAGGALLADAEKAFFRHADKESLYAPDGVHPSEAGSKLAANCIARAIESMRPYWVYLVRCEDGSYYTGITTDVDRRFQEHNERGPKAAQYTRTHRVVALEATWRAAGRSAASKLEYRVKQLTHRQKAQLADNPDALFKLAPDVLLGALPAD